MTNNQEMLALALRVEGASGPDRELDAEINLIANPGIGLHKVGDEWHARCSVYSGPVSIQGFTASLDAAMTLVPWKFLAEWRYFFSLEQDDFDPSKWIARADQHGDECGHGDTILSKPCADKERAVTAFALRAIASQPEKDGPEPLVTE